MGRLGSLTATVFGAAPTSGVLASVRAVVFHAPVPPPTPPPAARGAREGGPAVAWDGVWLFELPVGGRVYRFATETVRTPTASGHELLWVEGLDEPSTGWEPGEALSVTVTAEVDWALLVARGHALDRQLATVRRWYRGTVLEQARVILRGYTSGAGYGALGEALSITVRREPRDLSREVPPVQAVVDDTTWPVTSSPAWPTEIPDRSLGVPYPLVIGVPGYVGDTPNSPVQTRCVVPVPVAQWNAALGGATDRNRAVWLGGDASTVRLRALHLDTPDEHTIAVSTCEDLLGRTVQFVPTSDPDEGAEFLVGFDLAAGGGVQGPDGALVRGAGDVILWVLRSFYDGPVDWGRVRAVCTYLNAWKIDTWISDPVNAWTWLEDQVLSLLPVEVREGSRGVWLALLREDVSHVDVVRELVAGVHVDRDGPVASDDGEIANEVTVDYRPFDQQGVAWLGKVVVTARGSLLTRSRLRNNWSTPWEKLRAPVPDQRVVGSALAAESQRRFGVRPLRVTAASVWDTATALRTAQSILARRALPRRTVQYVGGPELERLDPGAIVALTDDEIHLERRLARVRDVVAGGGACALDLELLDPAHVRATR